MFTCKNVLNTRRYDFYTHVCDVFTCKNVLYTRHTSLIPMGAVNFYMQEHFLHSLIRLLYPCLRCIYLQECSVHWPYFYSHGCNKFLNTRTFFTLADTTFIPMFARYLPARMLCTLTGMSLIPMGAMPELETCFEPV